MSAACTISGASARNRVVPSDESTARRITVRAEREHERERERSIERGLRRDPDRVGARRRCTGPSSRRSRTGPRRAASCAPSSWSDRGADAGAPVVAPDPRVDGRDRERGVREVSLHLGALLDLRDDRGVEADAEVEHEAPPVGDAEADPPERPRRERREQRVGRFRGVVGDADACARTRWSTRPGAARARCRCRRGPRRPR